MDKIVFIVLCGLVFILPWEANFAVEGVQTGARMIGAVAFLAGFVVMLLNFSLRPLHRAFFFLGLYLAWCALSVTWSVEGHYTELAFITNVLLTLFVWLIWQYADTPSRQFWLQRMFICGTGVALVNLFLFYRGAGRASGEVRFTASQTNPNAMAVCLVLSIIFAYYLVLRVRSRGIGILKLGYWGFIVAAALGVLLTASRSGTIALALFVTFTGFFLLRSGRAGWKMIVMFVICGAAGIYLVPRLVPESSQQRVTARLGEGAQGRFEIWQSSIEAWKERPFLGGGDGTEHFCSHNTFVTILVDDGLIGLSLYLTFWASLLVIIFSFPKLEKQLWLTAVAGYAPCLVSGSDQRDKILWFLWAMILAQTITVAKGKALPRANQPPLRRFRRNTI